MRDDFSAGVRAVLAHRAGYRCSRPDCRASTAGPSWEGPSAKSNVGVAAHITAASEQSGRRYDPGLSHEQRKSAENGIWLCQTHAKEVDDDEARFPEAVLRSWKEHAETTARALLGRPISGHALEAAVEVSLQRRAGGGLVGVGTTNLPSGTRVWVELHDAGTGRHLGTSKTLVFDRHFASEEFFRGETPHPQDWYGVTVLAYFNGPWAQPESVIEIVGADGANLAGPHADLIDPDVEDSDTRLRARFECVAPPVGGVEALSDSGLLAAIDALKASVLEVEGKANPRSDGPVSEVVDHMMSYPDLREKDGWSAREVLPGVVEVTYSYWNGEKPDAALWHVIPSCGSVRYRNWSAKFLSWLPDY